MKSTPGQLITTIATLLIGVACTVGYYRAAHIYKEYRLCIAETNAEYAVASLAESIKPRKHK